jgi:hypothetical protein
MDSMMKHQLTKMNRNQLWLALAYYLYQTEKQADYQSDFAEIINEIQLEIERRKQVRSYV